jgi:hypothetical protein
MKENSENIDLDRQELPNVEVPLEIPISSALDVSEKVKKEVNDSIWDRLHPGKIDSNKFKKSERGAD